MRAVLLTILTLCSIGCVTTEITTECTVPESRTVVEISKSTRFDTCDPRVTGLIKWPKEDKIVECGLYDDTYVLPDGHVEDFVCDVTVDTVAIYAEVYLLGVREAYVDCDNGYKCFVKYEFVSTIAN